MKIYWWISRNGTKNLGDEISSIIVKRILGDECELTGLHDADVISTGSILGWVYERKNKSMLERKKKLTVLGSGFMHPRSPLEEKSYIEYLLVRGYLTKNLLGDLVNKGLPVGDPGILFSELVENKGHVKKYKYGIIPHLGSFGKKGFFDRFKDLENSVYIDFRTDDIDSVAELMCQCEVIISQSLHGLIFSDSLLLPNVWLNPGDLHAGGEFKFYDYFSTINRPFYMQCGDYVLTDEDVAANVFCADWQVIDNVKKAVLNAFEKYNSNCY